MKDRSLKILLGIIALNLTVQTLKGVELIPTAYAQSGVQKVVLCDPRGRIAVMIGMNEASLRNLCYAVLRGGDAAIIGFNM